MLHLSGHVFLRCSTRWESRREKLVNKIMELDADVLSLAPAPRDFSSSGGFFGGKMSQCFKDVARVSSDIPPGRRCSELHPSCICVESMMLSRSSWTTTPFLHKALILNGTLIHRLVKCRGVLLSMGCHKHVFFRL